MNRTRDTQRVLVELAEQGDDGKTPRSWWDSFEFDNFKGAFRFLKNQVKSAQCLSALVDSDEGKFIIRLLTKKAPYTWTASDEVTMLARADINGAKYLGWRCATVPKESETS